MSLDDYRRKRNFGRTSEPEGEAAQGAGNRFVVHEHHATRLHFDLRLEMEGVLKSWAVPKGPSMNPAEKRLAVMVEDHPLDYIDFRGEIEEGNYGAGEVEIWDSGTYRVIEGGIDQGKLVFDMFGAKLNGRFSLVRFSREPKNWLLIKGRDGFADPDWKLEQVLPGGSRKERKGMLRGAEPPQASPPASVADPMPERISPMLATLADGPFSDSDWLFEVKWDGYRAIAFITPDSFRLVSRRNENLIDRFPQAEAIPGMIDAQTAILDGEMVVVDSEGKPSFGMLQDAGRGLPAGAALVYYVFDLLYINGSDIRARPLIERKETLQKIVRPGGLVKYSDHVIEQGERFFEQVSKAGLEGMMAKRMDSPYVEKRSSYWRKVKAVREQEVVIGGYTEPRGSRQCFGALVVGVYEGDSFRFAGHVGTGFDDRELRRVHDLLQPLVTDKCPFDPVPATNEPATWVRPEMVCEVKFAEWTSDGILRQPVYLGMRTDKNPRDVIRERPQSAPSVPKPKPARRKAVAAEEVFEGDLKGDLWVDVDGAEVALTNLDKVYWPAEGYTKGDMLRYYWRIRETILPHLRGRPLILRRYPEGIEGESFYQHNVGDAPEFVRRVGIEEGGSTINYIVADNAASLLYVANLGSIGLHPFMSRAESLDRPDWIVLDLDPQDAPFSTICEVAMAVRAVLDEAGLRSYPKTSGSRGVHIYVPIEPVYTFDQAQDFGEVVARLVAFRSPEIATVERLRNRRGEGRVYVDYLQNAEGKTVASPYSVRPVPGAAVSAPLEWEEVASKPDKGRFTMLTVPGRVAEMGDVFADVLAHGQKLAEPLERLSAALAEVKNS